MQSAQANVVLIILAILILGAAGYMLFFRDDNAPLGITSIETNQGSIESEFLILTGRIEPITLDTGILEDPRFLSLQDIRTVILPELSGRTNPFAPL